jgi:apolipoprotein N-acyltransferase
VKIFTFIYLILFGCFYAAGFPLLGSSYSFISGPIIGFFGFFLYLERAKSLKIALQYSLFFSLGFYLLGFYWIPHTLTEFGQIPFPFNHILGINALFVICPHIFCFAIINKLIKNKIPNSSVGILLKVIIFLFLQYSMAQLFSAYPGHSWMKLAPHLFPAPIFGESIFSFISILIAYELYVVFEYRKFNILNWGISAAFFALCFFPTSNDHVSSPGHINIRIAQANIGNNAKLSAEKGKSNSVQTVIETYKQLSSKFSSEQVDLIIWPETAYPFSFPSTLLKSNNPKLPHVFHHIQEVTGASIFFGGYLEDKKSKFGQSYNSAFFIQKNEKLKVYNKNKLLPFGESLPFSENINEFIQELIPAISFFSKSNSTSFFTGKTRNNLSYSFIGFICYEALSPELLRNHLNSFKNTPQILINLTNDSWYGETSEPEQHLFLSKWRSVEFNRPMIRSSNTGISAVIDSNGVEIKRTALNSVEKLDARINLPQSSGRTIFQKWGKGPSITIILIVLLLNLLFYRKPFSKKVMYSNKA